MIKENSWPNHNKIERTRIVEWIKLFLFVLLLNRKDREKGEQNRSFALFCGKWINKLKIKKKKNKNV